MTADDSAFRTDAPQTGTERDLLQGFLDFHRGTLLWKVAGLTADQLVLRSVEPSGMSLIGLVRHVTEVERYWFQFCLAGRPGALKLWTSEHPDGDFDLAAATTVEQDIETFRQVVRESDEIGRGFDLGHTFTRPRREGEYSVRWLYLHLVEEYARHNGHADLLRERIDGMTGE